MALSAKDKATVWQTLNDTRGKIEPSEYKNYVFGVMFYKFLSEKAQKWIDGMLGADESWTEVWADDAESAASEMKSELGYAIKPGEMFEDWQKAIDTGEFNIMKVSDSINHFNQSIAENAKSVFGGIFDDMDLTSSRLGSNAATRTSTMMDWINMISKIENDDSTDVLGDLYEYLIGMFAANSGAKAGEFYTPHQVSDIMARILTEGRENLDDYSLYDPALGSGSLLLTTASYVKSGKVSYYGQEVITTTFNLARMNLLMHGVPFYNVHIKNGDTLEDDWPDGSVNGIDSPRMFDAVMANPPYSLKWDNTGREDDPRFRAGVAPKSKADYAFLLHGLYHLKQNGRMAIVLPHGVLFRGAAEGKIRELLLKERHIKTIIGLPEKIFTNTGIPTIIMVLEKNRESDDVLFIDASKGFEKQKNSNKLRQEDIDKIITTALERQDVDKYAHVASMQEIIDNDYNLNIPRYVDTFEEEVPVDAKALLSDMREINKEEAKLTAEINQMMEELVGTNPDAQETLDLLKQVLK
ncbi:type I restriction-modification system subunit M [Xylocopilactobacillus apis]|uniref:site-specific DNA-methyltransferase (adenine-specific) n=1 Tax=Xylocopilactobacillus apis TaxID=2932183 RepID=A0AAU9D1N7_9LACO|nr:type I restriction-modification system subunit M [Xylocopilactobacillus apis]BDR57448.1 type I restriction-modification system subunit M [Xylocopilactobacillus apis]